jgi:hypothetical protein
MKSVRKTAVITKNVWKTAGIMKNIRTAGIIEEY